MRILVTRAADQAEATAARLAAIGHESVVAPLSRVVFDREIALPLTGVSMFPMVGEKPLARPPTPQSTSPGGGLVPHRDAEVFAPSPEPTEVG